MNTAMPAQVYTVYKHPWIQNYSGIMRDHGCWSEPGGFWRSSHTRAVPVMAP